MSKQSKSTWMVPFYSIPSLTKTLLIKWLNLLEGPREGLIDEYIIKFKFN